MNDTGPPAAPSRTAPRDWGVSLRDGVATAALWAPSATTAQLVFDDGRATPLIRSPDGWFAVDLPGVHPGDRYRFVTDGSAIPDPASRSQPDGPDGWSEVVDLDAYRWTTPDWTGRPWSETVLYELHVGTFSAPGTFLGAIPHLDHLAALGVTMIELMPLNTFPGERNWGYDGVLAFAPHPAYGRPEDLQRLIDECHARRISVVLDVVYNHFGPQSNYIHGAIPEFFTDRHKTPWGAAINFDGPRAAAVRAFYIQNALHWLQRYRFDGLRLDAVQAIVDDSTDHFLQELGTRIRAAVTGRPIHLMLENDFNEARWLGSPYDGQWNDDFHHVMRVLVTGQTDGYYEDYAEHPIDMLGRALTEGFSYQGQESRHRPGMHRGTPSRHLPPVCFVNFLQNHDQVGNTPHGRRLTQLAPAEAVRLATAVLLLAPGIPMLFIGQEWAAETPFDYFCDYQEPLAGLVRNGRRDEFKRFQEFSSEAALATLADPNAAATHQASKLDWQLDPAQTTWLAFHTALLRVRASAIVPRLQRIPGDAGHYRAIAPRAIEVRWQAGGDTLVMAANFSPDSVAYIAPAGDVVSKLVPGQPGQLPPWGFRLFLTADRAPPPGDHP